MHVCLLEGKKKMGSLTKKLIHFSKLSGIAIIIFVLGLGGISGASANSLPGDFLYPIKIHIKEKIVEKITFTPKAKIIFKQHILETRLQEVEELSSLNRLTPEIKNTANINIQDATTQISININELQKTDPETAILESIKTENVLDNHKDTINSLTEIHNTTIPSLPVIDETKPIDIIQNIEPTKPVTEENTITKPTTDDITDHSSSTSKSSPSDTDPRLDIRDRLRINQINKDEAEIKRIKLENKI